MRILFVVPYPPSPIRVRSYNFIRGLAQRGHEVTVATLWRDDADRADIDRLATEGLEVIARPLSTTRSIWNCLRAIPAGEPLQAAFCWQPALARALSERLRSDQFDVIHVEHLRGARYALAFVSQLKRSAPAIPIVWDSVDCISHLFQKTVRHSSSAKGRWMARLDLARTRRYEARIPTSFDRVLATSEVDAAQLRNLAGEDRRVAVAMPLTVDVVPNAADLDYFRPEGGPRDPASLVFAGKMSYHANLTAALHLLRDIMPRVWSQRPDVKLIIVGKRPPRSIRDLADRHTPRVTVTGFVPDIRPYLCRATIAVAPLAYAAGTQYKVIEAMACGTPVVASPQAACGLSARVGEQLLVSDGAEAQANDIVSLLGDPDRSARIGRAGREYVERHHSWRTSAERLETIYSEALDTKQARTIHTTARNREPLRPWQRAAKAAIDFGLTLPALVLLSPLLAVIAVLVKIDSPGPILHRRRVLGRHGKAFDAFKIRTMHVDGDAILERSPALLAELRQSQKIKDDPRITRLGRWLRAYSLDELTQLINVLRGEMSLVGPRMISPAERERYGRADQVVLSVKPGLTGLWQVSGRADLPYGERVRLDISYVEGYSIRRDLKILFVQTLPAVLARRGAY